MVSAKPSSSVTPASIAAFTEALRGSQPATLRLVEAATDGESDLVEALRKQNEELLVAEEELRTQLDEILRVSTRAHVERERYRDLFDRAPAAYFVTDGSGIVTEVNAAASALAGLAATRLHGRPFVLRFEFVDRRVVRTAIEAAHGGQPLASLEARFRRANDEIVWVSLSCASAEQGRRLLWSLTDVTTTRMQTDGQTPAGEAAAGARIAELERALRDRDEVIARERRTRGQLERAQQAKDRFLAILSHDLRAPINAVLGWSQLLRTETFSKDARERALETIERNARAQLSLVEELLDVSRIVAERVRLELVGIDLAVLARRVVEGFAPAAEGRSIALSLESDGEPLPMFGDRKRLEQVLTNLLSNALKFTPDGGRIVVKTRREGDRASLVVADSGRGIGADLLPELFECFRQAPGGAARGLGLGLYIVRELVELHGGTVSASSEGEGRGATFEVRLPVREHEGDAPSAPSLPLVADDLDGLHVLLVEDEDDTRELISTVLARKGANVASAPDAATARAMAAAHRPDVLVSDIGLPGEDGYELLAHLRERFPDLPAIAVSGYASTRDAERALQAGFEIHVTKPVEPKRLVTALKQLAEATARRPHH